MKKIKTAAVLLIAAFAAHAQDANENNFNPFTSREFLFDTLHICTTLFGIYLVASFILTIIKRSLDQRIKTKILEKGTEENIITKLLEPDKKDSRNTVLQWICILTSIGTGLTLIGFFRPFGIHTVAIMAFSIAAGFLFYYLFTKQTGKQ